MKCTPAKRTVYDRTCRKTYIFDCHTSYYPKSSYGGSSGGYDDKSGYGDDGNSGYGEQSYDDKSGYDNSYGAPKPYCHKTPEEKCYKTPRKVSQQSCYSVPEKICEKMSENVPAVKPRQSCHMEDKRVCDLVKRTQPKQVIRIHFKMFLLKSKSMLLTFQVKKYVYSKQCRNVARQVCENADMKTLVPSCVPTMRKKCEYYPEEKCEKIPRKKCFNLAYKVRKQKCEPVPTYPEQTATYGETTPEPTYPAKETYDAPEPEPYGEPEPPQPSYGEEQPDGGY